MRVPELPDPPKLPSLAEIAKPVGQAVQNVEQIAGKIADASGITTAGKQIEESVLSIKHFAEQQIQSVLDFALVGVHFAASGADEVLKAAEREVQRKAQNA